MRAGVACQRQTLPDMCSTPAYSKPVHTLTASSTRVDEQIKGRVLGVHTEVTKFGTVKAIPPFLRFPIIPGPCPPAPFHPWILSLFHPFTLSPKMQKPCKNAGKMLFFISPWVPGCSLMAPKPCKNACFFFLQAEKHCKNAGKMQFFRTQGSKKLST